MRSPLTYDEPVTHLVPGGCPLPRDPRTGRPLRTKGGKYLDGCADALALVRPGWLQCRRCGTWRRLAAEVTP